MLPNTLLYAELGFILLKPIGFEMLNVREGSGQLRNFKGSDVGRQILVSREARLYLGTQVTAGQLEGLDFD